MTFETLTLELSRAQSEVDRFCRQRAAAIERDRLTGLRALPEARTAVDQHDRDIAAARAKRERIAAEAGEDARQRTAALDLKRRERNEEIERELRTADLKAETASDEAHRRARAKLDAALDAIAGRPLDAQFSLRQEVQRTFDAERSAARESFQRALEGNQVARTMAQRLAGDQETSGNRRTREETEAAIGAAERVFRAEEAALTARLLSVAIALPDGAAIVEDCDRQQRELSAECQRRREQLRQDFRKAKAEL